MEFDRKKSAGYLVNHMARLFARHLERRLRARGVALGAFPVLVHLWEQDGLTQRDLVDRLDVEQPTMAATLSRMERDGLVTRQRNDADARVRHVRLTERARRLRDTALADAMAVNEVALAGLREDERQQFLQLTARVIAALSAPEDSGPGDS